MFPYACSPSGSSGTPEVDPTWTEYFDAAARKIANAYSPRTVLDAGCRIGLLVDSLRRIGVDAEGVDPSEAAILQAAPAIRPFCQHTSLTAPFPHRYDLILLLDVVDHLPPEEAEAVIENCCRHTGQVLFASHLIEGIVATRLPTRLPEAWVEVFARLGFFRSPDEVAPPIYPGACVFRLLENGAAASIAAYERKLHKLEGEVGQLRLAQSQAVDTRAYLESQSAEKDSRIAALERQLREIQAGQAYRLSLRLRAVRLRLAPPGGILSRLWRGAASRLRSVQRRLDGLLSAVPTGFPADYQTWIWQNEPTQAQLRRQRREQPAGGPMFSLLMTVGSAPARQVQQTLGSLRRQSYTHWELWLMNHNAVDRSLARLARRDRRIRFFPDNPASELPASGEWLAQIDPGDLLAPFALFELAHRLRARPEIDLLYSDHDRLSPDGKTRHAHFFKPGWSPDLLRSTNYIHSLAVVRKSLFQHLWVQDEKNTPTAPAVDYDLYLKLGELTDRIDHLPQVLYHMLTPEMPGEATPIWSRTNSEIEEGVLKSHYKRTGLQVEVRSGILPGSHRAELVLDDMPQVSIIIPNRDQALILERCIHSILERSTYSNYQIFIVENNSTAVETFDAYDRLQALDRRVNLLHWQGPFNFSRINNDAARQSQGKYLLFLNNDTEVISPDWIERLLDHAGRPEVGAVGAKLLYPSGAIQHGGVLIGIWGIAAHSHKHLERSAPGYNGRAALVQNFSAVTAACMMIQRDVFERINGFDPQFQVAYNDVDLCLRLRREGYSIVWTPHAELYHHEQLTRGDELAPEARRRVIGETDLLHSRWANVFKDGDPFYNPNLTLDKEDYSLRLRSE